MVKPIDTSKWAPGSNDPTRCRCGASRHRGWTDCEACSQRDSAFGADAEPRASGWITVSPAGSLVATPVSQAVTKVGAWTGTVVLAKLRAARGSLGVRCHNAFGCDGAAAWKALAQGERAGERHVVYDRVAVTDAQLVAMASALNLAETLGAAKAWLASNPNTEPRPQCDRHHAGRRCQMRGQHDACMYDAGPGRDPVSAGQIDREASEVAGLVAESRAFLASNPEGVEPDPYLRAARDRLDEARAALTKSKGAGGTTMPAPTHAKAVEWAEASVRNDGAEARLEIAKARAEVARWQGVIDAVEGIQRALAEHGRKAGG